MVWRLSGAMLLSKLISHSAAYVRHWIGSALVQIMNQFWVIANWTIKNKLQWDFYQNSNCFIYENSFEIVVCGIASILSRGDGLLNYNRTTRSSAVVDNFILCRNKLRWIFIEDIFLQVSCFKVIHTQNVRLLSQFFPNVMFITQIKHNYSYQRYIHI